MPLDVSENVRERLFSKGIFLITDVSFQTIGQLTSWILNNRPKKKEFTILINSSGGSPEAVVRFASFLCTLEEEVRITGVAFDICGSAALALLQCCHNRIAVKHCAFFIHHIQTRVKLNCQEPDMEKVKLELASSRMVEDELIEIQCKKSGMTRRQWIKLADHGEQDADTPILTKKALELGLVDKIVKKFPAF